MKYLQTTKHKKTALLVIIFTFSFMFSFLIWPSYSNYTDSPNISMSLCQGSTIQASISNDGCFSENVQIERYYFGGYRYLSEVNGFTAPNNQQVFSARNAATNSLIIATVVTALTLLALGSTYRIKIEKKNKA